MSLDTLERRSAARHRTAAERFRLYAPDDICEFVPDDQWLVFRRAIQTATKLKIPFALGGGLAISMYTGRWRNSKDIDLYVLPADRERLIDGLLAQGMNDLFDDKPYDRNWIFRAQQDGVIVDVIWSTANGTGEVDLDWLHRGATTLLRGEPVRLVSPEEMLWSKVHVLQRDRCDWPDLLNLLYTAGPAFDWRRLLGRCCRGDLSASTARGDRRLLGALLLTFSWLAPGRAASLPRWLWAELQLPAPHPDAPSRNDERICLLDSRPWFTEIEPD